MNEVWSRRPNTRADFKVAIICALPLATDAVIALYGHHWDDGDYSYGKAAGDHNAYTTGAVGRHNVVLAHMPGMGKVNATAVAANFRMSFPNIHLAIVVGICGVVPFGPDGDEIILGDVIVSEGVIQYDSGLQQPEGYVRRDTLRDALGRADAEIRNLIAKLKTFHDRKKLQG